MFGRRGGLSPPCVLAADIVVMDVVGGRVVQFLACKFGARSATCLTFKLTSYTKNTPRRCRLDMPSPTSTRPAK